MKQIYHRYEKWEDWQNGMWRKESIHYEQSEIENVIEFTHGYDTIIGERGVTLSGGQKQRVSIARALINNPDLLILDDCLSAVDTKTEAEILGNLQKLFAQKTNVIISHRVSTVKDADHIIMLDDGKIIEEGSHQQLIQLNQRYAELYQNQISNERHEN